MSLLRPKNESGGKEMPTMRPVSMGRPLVTMSTYEERNETLKRTSFMPDDSCYRNSNRISLMNGGGANNHHNNNNNNGSSSSSANGTNGTTELPPPPPQFANPQQQQPQPQQSTKPTPPQELKLSNGNSGPPITKLKQPSSPMRSASISVSGFRPPATPLPDYETSSSPTTTQQQQRRTLRLGTVTIGEYGEQRGKRETLRKMNSITSPTSTTSSASSNGILKNGNRSSASFSSSRPQQPEKTIKFGN